MFLFFFLFSVRGLFRIGFENLIFRSVQDFDIYRPRSFLCFCNVKLNFKVGYIDFNFITEIYIFIAIFSIILSDVTKIPLFIEEGYFSIDFFLDNLEFGLLSFKIFLFIGSFLIRGFWFLFRGCF